MAHGQDNRKGIRKVLSAHMKALLLLLAIVCGRSPVHAQPREGGRWAVVEFSANFMREQPDYTAENGDQTLMGTVVEVVGEQGYWRRITSPEPYTAWVNEMGIVEMSEEQICDYIAASKYICICDFTHIYAEPSTESERISDFVLGGLVRQVSGRAGRPVGKGRFVACILPSGRQGWVLRSDVQDFAVWTASRTLTGPGVAAQAKRFLGVPYMWGGTSIKGVDCSGLALCAYFQSGVLLPRNASQQARAGAAVSLDSLEAGDLLFFGTPAGDGKPQRVSHVGIYLGEGRFIHSSQVVRISSLDPYSPDYYGRKPLCARRIAGCADAGLGVTGIAKSPYYFTQSE